ncbi:hypothetical protein [Parahaliea mediterranea]|uniref:Uncharacterized protein n=1 Tax=Parahaliea mediterranea TaxID=651086 RepID=A0A939IKC2_9GAMM|nr:hypothetical protein [Parahaliea mediterranea]MBN7798599.1 hypothetical protein [Parahaliea mediterranea]
MSEETGSRQAAAPVDSLERSIESAVQRLERARPFAKPGMAPSVLELARRLLLAPDGIARLYRLAPRLDAAGIFHGSDWQHPETLLAGLVANTFEQGDRQSVTIECISLLRALAVANGEHICPGYSPEQARHFLTQVMAHNLNRVFAGSASEVLRLRQSELTPVVDQLFAFLVEHIGYEDILGKLCDEIWRILGQRPLQVQNVKAMITQIALTLTRSEGLIGDARLGADRLISALFGPTQGCIDDPGLPAYRERLEAMDFNALQQEAGGFARAMHDVGLVSDYHASFLRWLLNVGRQELVADALGLSSTGRDCLQCYSELSYRLITEAIHTETAQAVYGLAMLLERGILYMPAIAPGLWRQIALPLSGQAANTLAVVFGTAHPPGVYLLAAVIAVLGQPLGVGQGNNPTCQSARAISMWAYSDPDYLLQMIAQVARFDSLLMHFEGQAINSGTLAAGLGLSVPIDNDPVSTLLVPHLDRIYHEMGQRCAGRGEDPHCWINPEFHGWWVGREFAIAVDVGSGQLKDYDRFLRHFFASYHPLYNGNQPMIHPQPAGLAMTDSLGRFVGWHAISLMRVALDQAGTMRVYFYNPNNDSGQDWGQEVTVSTQGNGERFGESSLPFPQLASRLYIFHDEPLSVPPLDAVPEPEVAAARELALASWARDRLPG